MGTVPIIQRGPLDSLFEDMPVILVNDFKDVTIDLLLNFRASAESTKKAWALYWHEVINTASALSKRRTLCYACM